MINKYTKVEINGNEIQFFELMGAKWVALGDAEIWSEELIKEEFGNI